MAAKYETIAELKQAIDQGDVDLEKISAFDCKGELFIKGENGADLFTAYYISHNACDDICALLGLEEPERV